MEKHEEHTEPDQKHIDDPTSVLYSLLPGTGGDRGEKIESDIDDEHLLWTWWRRPIGCNGVKAARNDRGRS